MRQSYKMVISSLVATFIFFFCSNIVFPKDKEIKRIYKDSKQLYKQEKWEEAVEGFDKVVKIDPEYKKAFYYLDKSNKKVAEMYYNLGLKLYNQGEIEKATSHLEKSVDCYPKLKHKYEKKIGEFYYQYGLRLYDQGKVEKAVESLKKCIQYDIEAKYRCERKIGEFYHEYGINLYAKNKFDGAIENLRMALQYEKDRNARKKISEYLNRSRKKLAEYYYELGEKNYEKDNLFKADKCFSKALSYHKYCPGLQKHISDTKSRMLDKAKEYYLEGLKEYDQGNIKKAIKLWEKTLQYDPDNIKAQKSLERTKEEFNKLNKE